MVVELKLSLELLWETKTGTYHRQEKDPLTCVGKEFSLHSSYLKLILNLLWLNLVLKYILHLFDLIYLKYKIES